MKSLAGKSAHFSRRLSLKLETCGLKLAFTLVELLAAVAVVAVGCVFVLGGLSQCSASLAIAKKTVTANHLLASKMWDIDLAHRASGGGEPGEWGGVFEPPHAAFRWMQTAKNISEDFGNATRFVTDALLEETVGVLWTQGKATRDVSVTRYVKRKRE